MLPEQLDFYFPFFVLTYGVVVTLVLFTPALAKLAEEFLPPSIDRQLKVHRGLALLCLFLGSLWSLQTIWLSQ